MSARSYRQYESATFVIPCSFLCPSDWATSEMAEQDECSLIYISGPRNQAGLYSTSLTVSVEASSRESLDRVATSLASKRSALDDYRKLGEALGRVAERPALELEIAYSMLLPLNALNPRSVAIRERHVLLEYDGQILRLSYSVSDDEYANWLEDFRVLVRTFSFPGSPEDMLSVPVVGGVWVDTLEGDT